MRSWSNAENRSLGPISRVNRFSEAIPAHLSISFSSIPANTSPSLTTMDPKNIPKASPQSVARQNRIIGLAAVAGATAIYFMIKKSDETNPDVAKVRRSVFGGILENLRKACSRMGDRPPPTPHPS